MGSRGYITFIINGEPKNAYNHDDSGPAHLGLRVLDWLRRADPEQLTASIENLKAVTEDQPPTPGQLRRLQEWSGSERTGRPEDQWYRLLRGTQGDPAAILAIGYVISDADYSLDAQWAYAVDADTRTFYAGNPIPGVQWPWNNLPDDTTFLAACARLIA